MKIKLYMLILIVNLISSCSSTVNIKNNISAIHWGQEEYLKYRKEFFDNDTVKNTTVKYFEGSYTEGTSSSFEPSVPSGNITKEEALKQNTYFKVIYSNGQQVKGIDIEDGVIHMIVYYDLKGRIIKRYNYYDNTFRLIKSQDEESLVRIYCYDKEKYCRKEHLSREKDANEYKEKALILSLPI